VSFYFLWVNPNNNPAVVNADAFVVLIGTVDQFANSETFGPAIVKSFGELNFEMVQPETAGEVAVGLWNLTSVGQSDAEWWLFGLGAANEADPVFLANQFHLQSNSLSIAPNATAVFEVQLQFRADIDDGWAGVDFSGDGGFVKCPFLQLEVLTPPAALQNTAKVNRKRAA
jgi:hypothetical protein